MWCWMAMRASNETVKCENLLNCRFVRPMPVQSARLGIPSPLDLGHRLGYSPGRVQLAHNNMRCDHPVDFAPPEQIQRAARPGRLRLHFFLVPNSALRRGRPVARRFRARSL